MPRLTESQPICLSSRIDSWLEGSPFSRLKQVGDRDLDRATPSSNQTLIRCGTRPRLTPIAARQTPSSGSTRVPKPNNLCTQPTDPTMPAATQDRPSGRITQLAVVDPSARSCLLSSGGCPNERWNRAGDAQRSFLSLSQLPQDNSKHTPAQDS